MRKNQKLGLVAFTFLAAGFGTWYLTSYTPATAKASPVVLREMSNGKKPSLKQRVMNLTDVPEKQKAVEHALEERWGHLGEEVLTATSIDKDGEVTYFDKNVVAGLTGEGKPIFAQVVHSLHMMTGPKLKEAKFKPAIAKLNPKAKRPGAGFLTKALLSGKRIDRSKMPEAWKNRSKDD